ncbi:chemotaxis protein methyltransferase CheR [Pullulanibacillus pueri]|uniref:protein-glutamate O-methyltransferase n=1 Tax=Pullulanibacillus pueri TaxID=1437324 RepID=A0A8J2ZVE0_9BACL|nr:protein-glutamate O-methyltransferase CheR [Pullulanibacillus pueri]MBM7681463.1 chemotaxis protein methyltransferase CheR [Pullulanibacillus pueri]GGH78978.1 chemotaxis protein methyltransferase [Pullulanibacillus pueri]
MIDDYEWFQKKIFERTGIDLALYKEEQMKRRLTSLKTKHKALSFEEYYFKIEKSSALFAECLDKITINVTEFFRNKQRWEVLEKQILPLLLKDRTHRLKVWSSACSTGEEPYSLSMMLSKYLKPRDYEVLATDIDEKVLKIAQLARYPDRVLKEVSKDERARYFKPADLLWEVDREVRKPVQFKRLNLLAETYGSEFDLILCRNVVIYFTDEAKQQLYLKFAQALRPGGVLFVGSTEQIFNPRSYGLEPLETFFYQKV